MLGIPKFVRAALLTAAATLAAAALVGCSSSSGRGLTLYNGQHEQTTAALVAAFEKATGIPVKIRSGDEGALAAQIRQEASSSPADVFYAGNTPALVSLDERGMLAPVDPTTLAAVPAQYSSEAKTWVGVSARVSGVIAKGQPPTSVLDLAKPEWKGKLGIAPSETDFQPVIASVVKSLGHDGALAWLRALKANAGSNEYPDNETLTTNVNKGNVQAGIVNHYYWYRLHQEQGHMDSAFTFFAPHDPGYVLNISGAAVLKSSPHQADAQKLLAFLVSAQGESILAKSFSFEYPLGSSVAANPALPPFDQLQPAVLTPADIGDGSAAVTLLHEAQLA